MTRDDSNGQPASARFTTRRGFLAMIAGGLALGAETLAMQRPGPAGIPVRPLGKTGASVSIVGFGGWDAGIHETDDKGVALLHEALDGGITFWDNAWEYNGGRSEEVMGKALAGSSRREKVFLMTKVCARDAVGVRRQLDESLRRLRTDHVDLLQFHAIQYDGDARRIFDPDTGGLKAVLEAKKAGKLRFLGFSGHRDPKVHLEMIGMPHAWDTVQMPLNLLDAHYRSFEKIVLPACREMGIGILGMKSLAGQDGRLPRDVNVGWELCRRYALSLPASTVICGMQTREEVQGMIRIASDFTPLTATEVERLLDVSRAPAQQGAIEVYKDPKSGYGCSYHSGVLKANG
jgi:aryl-alcohol dehydrogenase-like predicted oxidoreductase